MEYVDGRGAVGSVEWSAGRVGEICCVCRLQGEYVCVDWLWDVGVGG